MSIKRYLTSCFYNIDIARAKRLSQEGAWILIGQIAAVLGSLALVRVLTEHLQPVEYGELALSLTISALVGQVVMGGIGGGIARFYSVAIEKQDLKSYFNASKSLVGYAILVVLLLAVLLVIALILTGQSQWLGLAVAVMIFGIISNLNAVLSGIQNAARQRSIVALHSGLNVWLKIGLIVIVIPWLGASSFTVVIAHGIAALVVTASQLYFLRCLLLSQRQTLPVKQSNQVDENWIKQIWIFAWPFSIWGAFTWVQQVSDRWALGAFATVQQVGQYAVLFQLGYTPISLVTALATSFLGPILYQRSGAATDNGRNISVHRLAWRITGTCLVLTGLAFLISLLFHSWLFKVLVAPSFRDSSYFLPWIVLSGGLFASGQMIALKLMSEINIRAMTAAKIVTAIFGTFCNFIAAWFFGLSGIIGSLLLFSLLYFAWMTWLGQKPPELKGH